MIPKYQVWTRWGNTKEELENSDWIERICFANLKHKLDPQPILFEAKFKNLLDNVATGYSTTEWLEEFKLSAKAHKGIISISVEKEYYYIILNMSILSHEWASSILTLFRYPGEYYNICWNYWKIREKYSTLDKWKSLYLAHQGTFETEYKSKMGYSFSYNIGHSLFRNGQKMSSLNIKSTFKRLDKVVPYIDKEASLYFSIQGIWGGEGYTSRLNFDIPNCFIGTHVDKEIV